VLTLEEMVEQELFICPRCAGPVRAGSDFWRCSSTDCLLASEPFPVVSGHPALVDFENSILGPEEIQETDEIFDSRRGLLGRSFSYLSGLLEGDNCVAQTVVARMLELLRADSVSLNSPVRNLVVGGGTLGGGLDSLYGDTSIDLIAFDIFASPIVQFIADGHSIPLADESVDGVIVQAVLEHVLEPSRVAQEIYRVLRQDGIVYADTPFMQQVHMGPYDFTRFTDSGHRYLFRGFERIDSGPVAGAGTALVWSIDRFVRALTRSARLGMLVRLCFFWLRKMDPLLDQKHSIDSASSIFFLGRKKSESITKNDIIEYYRGGIPRAARH
jgi:SAM-dependent methyltransferase